MLKPPYCRGRLDYGVSHRTFLMLTLPQRNVLLAWYGVLFTKKSPSKIEWENVNVPFMSNKNWKFNEMG